MSEGEPHISIFIPLKLSKFIYTIHPFIWFVNHIKRSTTFGTKIHFIYQWIDEVAIKDINIFKVFDINNKK